MKKLVLTILFFLCLGRLFSWDASITLYFTDNIGRIDSVIFGINEISTLGIDSTLGENNIFKTDLDSLDVRVIQRDSINHRCCGYSYSSNDPQDLYFPANIDSKIDFRPFGGFYSEYNNFEISIHAIEYPIIITAKYIGITGHASDIWADIYLLDNECNPSFGQYGNPSKDTLTIINDDSFTTLIASFQHEVGIENYKEIEPNWKIFPNPTNSFLTIFSNDVLYGNFEVLDIDGRRVKMISIENKYELCIDLNDKPSGVYLVKYSDIKTGIMTTKKIIKN